MPVLTSADAIKLGSTAVDKLYLGSTQVWSSGDTDANAFITAAGIVNSTQQAAVQTLVTDLKAASLWSKLIALYPYVGGTGSSHKYNLKDPRDLDAAYRLTFTGSWTHSSTGAKPDGSTTYADTHLNAASALSATSGSMGFYSRTDAFGGQPYDMGCDDGDTNPLIVIARYNNNNSYTCWGDDSDSFVPNGGTPDGDGRGFFCVRRISGTTYGHKNGIQFCSASPAVALPSRNVYLGGNNRAGSATYLSTKEHALTYFSSGLTSPEMSSLYTIVQAFQATLGRDV